MATPQRQMIPIWCPTLNRLAPSNATFRIASFRYVNGRTLQIGCNHEGNAEIEKNVPDNKNCGSVMMFAIGGMELSFLAIPETANPNPIKTIKPNVERTSMLMTVAIP